MRARKKRWTQRELEENYRIAKDPEKIKGNWNEYFGKPLPIHVEIGCGKGRFITELAAQNLDIHYIAVEKEQHVIVSGARLARLAERQSDNLAFILGDVRDLPSFLGPGEMKRLYINFCDPWPNRKKWHKRRLTHSSFLKMYRELFDGPGEIFLKTDNLELFEFSIEQLTQEGWALRNISRDLHQSGYEGNIMTEYEEKFASLGMPIFRLEGWVL